MRIFALETDVQKLIQGFLSKDEMVLLTVRFHGFLFLVRAFIALFYTLILLGIAVAISYTGLPLLPIITVAFVIWLLFIAWRLFVAWIDWRYDVLVVTTEELIVVSQSSIFHQEVKQMSLDNIASVHAKTQFWNLFPFGTLAFELKEGRGAKFSLGYIPQAAKVASVISDTMTLFQRRKAA